MRRLLWVGDAACSSGNAKSTHHVLDVLRHTWDVTVLGLNYRGDPHPYPYPIYPTFGRDTFGLRRLPEMLQVLRPDVVVVQSDAWNFPEYLQQTANIPTMGIVAVDGRNCRGTGLNGLRHAIFWTQFGLGEARMGGYRGTGAVIPLGVDLTVYAPRDRVTARKRLGLERLEGAFIVGAVNQNQPRKRLDLTVMCFAEWVKAQRPTDAYLFIHAPQSDTTGYDLKQLASYYGVQNRLILSEPEARRGETDDWMVDLYNAFDVQVTTSQGEGFGLTVIEGMACGIPQIVPRCAALGEWPGDTVRHVACPTVCVTPNYTNAVGAVPDLAQLVTALRDLHAHPVLRQAYSTYGLARVAQPEFRWERIGARAAEEIELAAGMEV